MVIPRAGAPCAGAVPRPPPRPCWPPPRPPPAGGAGGCACAATNAVAAQNATATATDFASRIRVLILTDLGPRVHAENRGQRLSFDDAAGNRITAAHART